MRLPNGQVKRLVTLKIAGDKLSGYARVVLLIPETKPMVTLFTQVPQDVGGGCSMS